MLIGDIAIGESTLIDFQLFNQLGKIFLRINPNTFWIKRACQFGRVLSTFDIRDLCGRKCDHIEELVVAIVGVKIVEISSRRTDDNYIPLRHFFLHVLQD
jgi:hypothetical protein